MGLRFGIHGINGHGTAGECATTYGRPAPAVEYFSAPAVKTRLVDHGVTAEPHDQSLIGTAAFVFRFAGASFALIRARLDNVNHTPELPDFGKALLEISAASQKAKVHKVCDDRSCAYAFEYIDPGYATRTHDI